MKTKNKIIMYLMLIMAVLVTSIVIANTENDLSSLKNSGYSKIGDIYRLGLGIIDHSKDTYDSNVYCIQYNKPLNSPIKIYTVNNYIEINGKEAKVYSDRNGNSTTVNNDLNAQVAYILNQKYGYGENHEGSDGQRALWHITSDWTKALSLSAYSYEDNDKIPSNGINDAAKAYSDEIGDKKLLENSEEPRSLRVEDKTVRENITVTDVGGYYRVGPFNWEFEGTLQTIEAKSESGNISNIRIVKNIGNTQSIVNVSDISSGESFYVDVDQNANEFTGLKLSTKSESENTKVYTAKIWVLSTGVEQNLIYTDVGEGDVKPLEGENTTDNYGIPLKINIGFLKVDDRDKTIPLEGVGFKLKATVYRDSQWVTRYLGNDLKWSAVDINGATVIKTDKDGKINETITGETTVENSIKAIEVINDKYGYADNIGKEFTINRTHEVTLQNHQSKVKLSGYVWIDTPEGKTSTRDDQYTQSADYNGNGFNGITVYLRDKNGNEVKRTKTSELGLYSEINGGEYQFVDVDLDKLQVGEYYVEFEYCGIIYQSVATKLTQSNGSKAKETKSRDELDSKFTSVDGNGTDSLKINGVTVNYNGVDANTHQNSIKDCSGCDVYANTKEAGYNIYSDFKPATEEIRNINLGLYKKAQADYRISQDLYNVRVTVNGFSHIYRYGTEANEAKNQSAEWNVGVQFQNNRGTYNRAIYTADAEYQAPNHKDNELKVYLTYQIRLINESTYLGRINNIIDYSDNDLNMIAAGTNVDDKDSISGNLKFGQKTSYDEKYSSNRIDVNTTIKAGTESVIYVQYELNRDAVLKIVNNKELLNSTVEINSYTTFKNNNEQTPVAVVDKDSVPGNAKPSQINTYEDDTFGARSLKLELRNARSIEGTVFVDASTVNKDNERLGNGIFDNGETTIAGVRVRLNEIGKDDSSYDGERVSMETTTDANGNFKFEGYIPGNYNITYTWGNKTYKVQYYKGTTYDESRDQKNKEWYKVDVDTRRTDALDDANTRKTIDAEMRKITGNNLEDEINKAYETASNTIKTTTMDSTTPGMAFSVEYDTTITDGNDDKVEFKVKNIDFGIVERPKQQMDISKRVSGFKITLANGQVLIDAKVGEDGKLEGSHDNVTYMGPTSTNNINVNGILRAELDSELIEGATLEATYAIKVTNTSEKDYDSERYYYYANKEGAQLVKSSVTGVIDYLDGRLAFVPDGKWEEKDKTFITEVNASQKDNTDYLNSTVTYFTKELQKPLVPGESNEITFNVSKLLTSSEDNTFDNKSEIVDVTKTEGFNTGTPVKVTWNNGKFFFDVDNSEEIVVIPSTGENKSYVLPTVIGIIAITIVGVGVFFIKKYVVDKK